MFQLQSRVFRENKSRTETVDGLLPGDFQNHINNYGSICLKDLEIIEKAETFVLYTYDRSSRSDVFCKKVFLEISQNSHENTCARVSILIDLQA